MRKPLLTLLATAALVGATAPALAEKGDKMIVDQYRDKITAARAEPGVAQYGSADLDQALAALPGLEKALDDNKPARIKAATTQIDALIASARTRADAASAKQGAADAAAAKKAQTASAEADAEAARARAAQAQAEAARAKSQLADLQMKQSALGATLVLQDVVFQTGKADLKPGAEARLRPLAAYLRANPNVKVRIDGHTDAQGSDSFNLQLSQARAAAVRTALGAMGVDGARIEAVGHGEAAPVADNATAAGRQQNRRVEITLVGQQASALAGMSH